MYYINKASELIGKEIAFVHFAQFADAAVIVTKDKGIFMFDMDDEQINVYRDFQVKQKIFGNKWVRKELNKLGIITNEDILQFDKALEDKRKADNEKYMENCDDREYKDYLRLKEKYETK